MDEIEDVDPMEIEIAGIRIRAYINAPDGMMVVFKEQRNKGHILAVPSRSAEPKRSNG